MRPIVICADHDSSDPPQDVNAERGGATHVHELSICQGILDVASAVLQGQPGPLPRVADITVRIGRLSAVVPDTLQYYFALLTPGTVLDGAALIIEEVPIRGGCTDCGGRFEIETLSFTCPRCGGGLVELITGRELEVVSLDTVEEVPCAG